MPGGVRYGRVRAMTYDITDLIVSFERHLRVERLSTNTIDAYSKSVNLFAKWLANKGLEPTTDSLTTDNLVDWFIFLDYTYKPTTYLTRFKSMKAFCIWVLSEYDGEVLPGHPMQGLKQPKLPTRRVPVIRDSEVKALIKACRSKKGNPSIHAFTSCRNEAIIRILYDTGIRISELLALTMEDIIPKQDLLIIHGKGEKTRVVPFSDKTGIALDRYTRLRKKHKNSNSKYLWISDRGTLSVSSIRKMLERLCEKANIPKINPHRFRHTMIHNYLDNGGQERNLKRLTGHSSSYALTPYTENLAAERAIKEHKRLSLGDRI